MLLQPVMLSLFVMLLQPVMLSLSFVMLLPHTLVMLNLFQHLLWLAFQIPKQVRDDNGYVRDESEGVQDDIVRIRYNKIEKQLDK